MTVRKWILLTLVFSMLAGCGGPWSSGDRVLVSKCAFDNGVIGPNRYDVVVFKYPVTPIENGTPKNYIKRLLGMPGELLAIFFGRIYRWNPPKDAPAPFDDLKDPNVSKYDLWQTTYKLYPVDYMHRNDETSRKWFEEGQFEIVRKPARVMLATRRIVYDNDYQAKDRKGKFDRWNPSPKSGWKADKGTGFTFEGKAGDDIDWLRYQHLVRPDGLGKDGAPRLITDTMSYNSIKKRHGDRDGRAGWESDETPQHPYWVGDLMLECNVQVVEPKGELFFELSKGIFRYRAHWDLATGKCTLTSIAADGKEKELAFETTSVKSPGNYLLRLANVDARLTVWVDRALPFGEGKDYDPPEIRAKTDKDEAAAKARRGPHANDLEPASIGSKGANVKISHVRLWRDTYYNVSVRDADYDRPPESWSDPSRWDSLKNQRFATLYVQPGHYLCLGDNSQASSDGREWGVVPERLMLGRALVVYFPLDRIGPIR